MRGSPERKHREKEELDCVLETDRSAWCGVNPRGAVVRGDKLGMRKKQKLDRAVPEGHLWVSTMLCLPSIHLLFFWGGAGLSNKRQGARFFLSRLGYGT